MNVIKKAYPTARIFNSLNIYDCLRMIYYEFISDAQWAIKGVLDESKISFRMSNTVFGKLSGGMRSELMVHADTVSNKPSYTLFGRDVKIDLSIADSIIEILYDDNIFELKHPNIDNGAILSSRLKSKEKTIEIKNVIFNDPATIVFWKDGTKTIVKADEEFDPEKGLAMAISKKVLGNKGNYYNEFKKWLD